MDKCKDFPLGPRVMSDEEGELYFNSMLAQIKEYNPQSVIAVARSGFSYAMWISQILGLPLGVYWPDKDTIVELSKSSKTVFVDDNILQGETFNKCTKLMAEHFPNHEWKWAVLFSDWHTPPDVRQRIIQGTRLPYFAEEPIWGSKKVSAGYGIRFRDE